MEEEKSYDEFEDGEDGEIEDDEPDGDEVYGIC